MKKFLKPTGIVVAVAAAILTALGSISELMSGDLVAASKAAIALCTTVLAGASWWVSRQALHEQQLAKDLAGRPVRLWLADRLIITLRASVVNRIEVLGRLGMIPMVPVVDATGKSSMPRFDLAYLASPGFTTQLDQVASGARSDIYVPASSKEFGKFNWQAWDALPKEEIIPSGPAPASSIV